MTVVDILSLAAAFAVTAWFLRLVLRKDRDAERYGEDDARDFLEEHGRWPDESPDDAAARARRSAEAERIARQSYRGG